MFTFSQPGIAAVVVVIVLLILISIQFTLNQILRELREIRKKVDLKEINEENYRRRDRNE